MTRKQRKAARPSPDLTVEADSRLKVFTDKPRGDKGVSSSQGIVTSYDPAVAAMKRIVKRKRAAANARPAQAKDTKSLATILDDCLRAAVTIKNKHGTELVKLLRDARRRVG